MDVGGWMMMKTDRYREQKRLIERIQKFGICNQQQQKAIQSNAWIQGRHEFQFYTYILIFWKLQMLSLPSNYLCRVIVRLLERRDIMT